MGEREKEDILAKQRTADVGNEQHTFYAAFTGGGRWIERGSLC